MKLIPKKVTLGKPGTYEYKVKIETESGDFVAGIHFENRKISRAELKRWETAIQIGVDSLHALPNK